MVGAQYMLAHNIINWFQWARHHAKHFSELRVNMPISHGGK